jgi:hypothetical protein
VLGAVAFGATIAPVMPFLLIAGAASQRGYDRYAERWSGLELGMTAADVRAVMGNRWRVERSTTSDYEVWSYMPRKDWYGSAQVGMRGGLLEWMTSP